MRLVWYQDGVMVHVNTTTCTVELFGKGDPFAGGAESHALIDEIPSTAMLAQPVYSEDRF